jgi:hypothetical protein
MPFVPKIEIFLESFPTHYTGLDVKVTLKIRENLLPIYSDRLISCK